MTLLEYIICSIKVNNFNLPVIYLSPGVQTSAEAREVVGFGGGIWRSLAFRGLGWPQMLLLPKWFWDSALESGGQQSGLYKLRISDSSRYTVIIVTTGIDSASYYKCGI